MFVVVGVGVGVDEANKFSKRTKEQTQTKNETGITPSNQTRRQAGGFLTYVSSIASVVSSRKVGRMKPKVLSVEVFKTPLGFFIGL